MLLLLRTLTQRQSQITLLLLLKILTQRQSRMRNLLSLLLEHHLDKLPGHHQLGPRQSTVNTTNDYANVPSGRIFSCPVPQYRATITETWTNEMFYKHMEDDVHTTYMYYYDSHICPFECHQEFLNDFALFRHIQKQSCEKAAKLFHEIKTCKQCNDHSPDIIGALDHLEDDHSDLLSVTGSPYVCTICNVGFPTRELFRGHFVLVSQVSTSHIAIVKSHNIWSLHPL
jgi:hypothetical protein